MTAPGDDPADRDLDDALALANDTPRGARTAHDTWGARHGHEPGDEPTSVIGKEDAPGTPSRAASGVPARSQGGVGQPAARVTAPPGDPLAVALHMDDVHGVHSGDVRTNGVLPDVRHTSGTHVDDLRRDTGDVEPGPLRGRTAKDGSRSAGTRHGSGHAARHHHKSVAWGEARRVARGAGRRLPARVVPLGDAALGSALARSLRALTDLPSFDSSAMDGWAVAGAGPWRLAGQVLAGRQPSRALLDGHATAIATGAPLPAGATAVLRNEHGRTEHRTDGVWLRMAAAHLPPAPGQDVRPRGLECHSGDELLAAGTVVTPAVLGLAAAAGYDELAVIARPRVEVLVLGDELLERGVPRGGRVRDALGPMLPAWLRALGADVTAVRRLVDDADALRVAVTGSVADVVVTTGGTAGGPVDHVHPVLAALGARLLIDGVAVRPGHPMLMAALPVGEPAGSAAGEGAGGVASGPSGARHLIGLPGNPLAAVSGVLTLVAPLLRTLAGHPAPAPYTAPLTADVHGHPADTRLVPVVFDDESAARPLHFAGPAMLRGLAAADGMAVIPPTGARAGDEVTVLGTGGTGAGWGSGG